MKDARDKNGLKLIMQKREKMCNEQCYLVNWWQGGEQELRMPICNSSKRTTDTPLRFWEFYTFTFIQSTCKIQRQIWTFFPLKYGGIAKRLDEERCILVLPDVRIRLTVRNSSSKGKTFTLHTNDSKFKNHFI